MKIRPIKSRRATVLLLVVSMLALLFVIVTGYLSLSRVERDMIIDVSQSEMTDAVLEDTADWAVSLIGRQLLDGDGKIAGGETSTSQSFEDIPGYRGTHFLASTEPVWDGGAQPTFNGESLEVVDRITWPAVTSFDSRVAEPHAFSLKKLMLETDEDRNQDFTWPDVMRNARRPFMDADGDGVPDSQFLLSGPATKSANAMAGVSVQLPPYTGDNPDTDFVTYAIPRFDDDADYRDQIWRRFDDSARYETAVRIVSHGGMVALQSPTLYNRGTAYEPFNREFTIGLFDAVRNIGVGGHGDPAMSQQYSQFAEQNTMFDELQARVTAVESRLRRRFMLPGYGERVGNRVVRGSPPVLAKLQGEQNGFTGFPKTFSPVFGGGLQGFGAGNNWQRINLGVEASTGGLMGSPDERLGWAQAAALRPDLYNAGGTPAKKLQSKYDRRHITTAISYSDELARKQTAGDQVRTPMDPLGLAGANGSTYRGELKFYLGEISKAFIEVDIAGALSPGSCRYAYDVDRGKAIVEELARYYYDMLAGHSGAANGWENLTESDSGNDSQAVSRRQQAFMLAVNTVAFAAPRDNVGSAERGSVDVVRYTDLGDATAVPPEPALTYVGYGPQPFFSEVVAYTAREDDDDEDDDPNLVNAVLAVELYNPADPHYDTSAPLFSGVGFKDVYSLPLNRFALSVDDTNPNNGDDPNGGWAPLVGFTRMRGRDFVTVVVKDKGNSDSPAIPGLNMFLAGGGARPNISLNFVDDRPSGGGIQQAAQPITLHLWRSRANNVGTSGPIWYHVDEIDVSVSKTKAQKWSARVRDTTPARYLGMTDSDSDGVLDAFARWNVVTGPGTSSSKLGLPDVTAFDSAKWNTPAGVADPDNPPYPNYPGPFAPTVPLLTMNAGPDTTPGASDSLLHQRLNNLPLFGNLSDRRPRSFPTVGFMLFVPRFSHVQDPTAGLGGENTRWIPISGMLQKQWTRQSYSNRIPGEYPVDFGHMPIFDNTQAVQASSYFNNTNGAGRVPWGLLVFDYFTTLDRTRDANRDGVTDVDPLRVPGRININTAPWWVLSKLPMLGPDDDDVLPIAINSSGGLMLPNDNTGPIAPSPAFWDPAVGVLVGHGWDVPMGLYTARLLGDDAQYFAPTGFDLPYAENANVGLYRLGPWLAQSAAAYRDGVQYYEFNRVRGQAYEAFIDSHLRGGDSARYEIGGGGIGISRTYRTALYSPIRGAAQANAKRPQHFGFVTVGGLANVKGFDSSRHSQLPPFGGAVKTTLGKTGYVEGRPYAGDFVKAVSLTALLDSQYLVTRSNTFTIYASVMDREDPKSSMRLQQTVDRSNLLPRMTYVFQYKNQGTGVTTTYPLSGVNLTDPDISSFPVVPALLNFVPDSPPVPAIPETAVRRTNEEASPRVISTSRIGYFNARYDQ